MCVEVSPVLEQPFYSQLHLVSWVPCIQLARNGPSPSLPYLLVCHAGLFALSEGVADDQGVRVVHLPVSFLLACSWSTTGESVVVLNTCNIDTK